MTAHPAAQSAVGVAAAGFGVVAIRTDTDEKKPTLSWRPPGGAPIHDPAEIDLGWPRWAAVCGEPRAADGASLVCLDADSAQAVKSGRGLLPYGSRVTTGRPGGGEHNWVMLPADAPAVLRRRFYLGPDLDWRGGSAYALLPGSMWAPVSAPTVTYLHVGGPPVASAPWCPPVLQDMVARVAESRTASRPARSWAGRIGSVRLDPEGAYERFLAAAVAAGRRVDRRGQGRAFVSCPTSRHPHGNRRPALYVTADVGRVGVHCFARECPPEEIVQALGLTLSALFDPIDLQITFTEPEDS